MERLGLKLAGLSCVACAKAIEQAIAHVPGVVESNVNFDLEIATVRYDRQATTAEVIIQAVTTAGYQATSIDSIVGVASSRNETLRLRNENRNLSTSVETNLVLQRSPVQEPNHAIELLIAIVLSLLLIIGSVPTIVGRDLSWIPTWLQHPIGQLILATPVQFWCGRSIFISAKNAARHHRVNSHTLVALSTGVAYFYALINTFRSEIIAPDPSLSSTYYQISAVTIVLMLLGKQLERRAQRQTKLVPQSLINIQPQLARIVGDREEKLVPIYQVGMGQIISILPGEMSPVDGIIVAGESMVDRSIVTGESQPLMMRIGDEIIGRFLNYTGKINVRVTKINDRTFLAQISELVDRIRGAKVPIQRLADRVAASFFPLVIIIALVTSMLWLIFTASLSMAITTGIGVLIIACPSALGLATSTAIVIGTKKGIERGIIIKNGASLEILGRVNTIVFDKTGTLTTGRSLVTNFIPVVDNYHGNELDILQLAASIANQSKHPLSPAIVSHANRRQIVLKSVEQFAEIIGSGASGIIDRKLIQMGTSEWMVSLKIATVLQAANYQILTNYQQQWEAAGNTVIWIAIDREIAGIIGISDEIKPTAVATISRLKAQGLEVVLLSGDNFANTDRLAQYLGIDRVFAQIEPHEKAQIIETLQSRSNEKRQIVVMVGDGIDDAPALAQADVGIAICTATDMAIAASDLMITSPDLQAIVTAIELSRSTLTKIEQNLFFAFVYNIICIPIAAGMFYPGFGWLLDPAIASVAMVLSSGSVLANAWRKQLTVDSESRERGF